MAKLNTTEQKIAELFSDNDIKLIDEWLSENLEYLGKVQRPDVYAALGSKTDEKLDEAKWSAALSFNIKSGRLAGYTTMRGRYGGILKGNGEEEAASNEAPKPAEKKPSIKVKMPSSISAKINTVLSRPEKTEKETVVVEDEPQPKPRPQAPPPAPTYKTIFHFPRHLWIDNRMFLVSRSTSDIRKLLVEVLKCSLDDNGAVTFDGKRWSCSDVDLLERFLSGFFHAVEAGESIPVLDDGSGISVELRL